MAGKCFMQNVTVSKNKLKETAELKLKKYRDETGLFVIEGFKALEEAIESGIEIIEIFSLKEMEYINTNLKKPAGFLRARTPSPAIPQGEGEQLKSICLGAQNDNLSGRFTDENKIKCPVYIIDEKQMKKICQTSSPCGVLAVSKKREYHIEEIKKLNRIVMLESVSDPGNLGTVIRSAAAFGIEGLILYGSCTDLYSSKVIRSAAGNFFKVPVIEIKSKEEFEKHFKDFIKISSSPSREGTINLNEISKIEKYVIMLGSEALGLSEDLLNTADKNINIEMKNGTESLNLAVSASIVMYEACRSRQSSF